jgi:uncharacterized membrane protein HdeD (DUF308 family)
MKIFQSSIFRAICAIVVGVLLIKYPEDGVTWLTVAIGVLFLLSGIIAVIAYLNARKHASEYTITDQEGRIFSNTQPTFPIVGAGSIILGLTLALTPGVFIHGLMYILGAIMILGGLNQLMALISARRLGEVPYTYWIAPSLVLIDLLLKAGAVVRVYDPVAMDECRRRLGDTVTYATDMYDAAKGADALMLVTEWKELRMPNMETLQRQMRGRLVLDGRNILDAEELHQAGFEYHCIGR